MARRAVRRPHPGAVAGDHRGRPRRERFQGEAARLRQGIVLDGARYAVVGVAPSGLDLFGDWQVWLPDVFRTDSLRGWHHLNVLGRLRPGVTPED